MNNELKVVEQIHSSDRSSIFLVEENASKKQYLLKQNNMAADARIYNEVELFKESETNADSKLIEYLGNTAYIRPYYQGISLSKYIKTHQFTLLEFLQIAISLCDKLNLLHSKGIIHKDINPSNIILNPTNLEVNIIDLEHATLLSQQVVAHGLITYIEGTLAYIPPEQTGRTGRKIDYRSDYYSLGATFYEVLTNRTPFSTTDPLELIHCHLAVLPDSPSSISAELPEVISNIVLKLLTKNAEERYQTLSSLRQDLEKCLTQLQKEGRITLFKLGEKDAYGRYLPLLKTYGRQAEISAFKDLITKNEERHLLVLQGASGSGKSLLLHELGSLAAQKDIKTYRADYSADQENQPYFGWIGLLSAFCNRVDALDEDSKKRWKSALKSSLKGLEIELVNLLPQFGVLIDCDPVVLEKDSTVDGRSRILLAWNKFFECLVGVHKSIIVFLDDLQWADEGSFTLIDSLLSNSSIPNLTIVAAYRPSNLENKSSLSNFRDSAIASNSAFSSVLFDLENLNEVQIEEYLIDSFVGKGDFRKLATVILEKTKGLPIAVTRFCENLHLTKKVKWDASLEKWSYNLEEIKSINISKKVAEIILSTIDLSDVDELSILKTAAACGKNFSIAQIELLTKRKSAEIHRLLWNSIKSGIILPQSEEYHYLPDFYETANQDVFFVFAHDHIWETIYKLQSSDEKFKNNESLATFYSKDITSSSPTEVLFNCANYVYRSSVPFQKTNRSMCFDILAAAGTSAMQNNAFQLAYNYLKSAINLIAPEGAYDQHTPMLCKWVESSYYIKSTQDFNKNYNKIDKLLQNPINQARLAKMKVICLTSSTKYSEAIALTEEMLIRLGSPFPKNPGLLRVIFELIQTPINKMSKIDELPLMTNEKSIIMQELLSETSPAFLFTSPYKYAIMTYRMIRRTLSEGLSPDSGLALSFGMLTTGILRTPLKAKTIFEKIKSLLRSNKMNSVEPVLLFVESMVVQHWFEPYSNLIGTAKDGEKASIGQGNIMYLGWNKYMQIMISHYGGLANVETLLARTIDEMSFSRQYKLLSITNKYYAKLIEFKMVSGRLPFSNVWDFEDFKEGEFIARNKLPGGDVAAIFGWYVSKGNVFAQMGEFSQALDYLKISDESKASVENTIFHSWLKQLVVMLSAFENNHTKWATKIYKTLKANAKGGSPEMNLALQIHDALRLKKAQEVEDAVVLALEKVKGQDNKMLRPLIYLLLAEKLRNLNKPDAVKYFSKASEIWMQDGAIVPAASAKKKAEMYTQSAKKENAMHSNIGSSKFDARQLDVATLIKSGEAILSEIKLEPLIQKLMHYSIENAGAQIGYFILKRNDDWSIELRSEASNTKKLLSIKQNLKGNNLISEQIINEALVTQKSVLIQDAVTTEPYSNDEIIKNNKTHSLLCIPLIHQNKVSGFIYLENNLMLNAFQEERVGIITLLSGQISMAIENALLYEDMENQVAQRTLQLAEEKRKSDKLLINILPEEVAEELKNYGKAKARKFEEVTVMFTDFKNFSSISKNLSPEELVSDIDEYFSAFDEIIERYGLEKIKTIGDAYMCAGGLPKPDKLHAEKILLAAFEMQEFMENEAERRKKLNKVWYELRIGINSGAVVAGIVGTRKFAYDIWGDTVNIAARMESSGTPGKINISEFTTKYISDKFVLEPRGKLPVKNLGELFMYYVNKA